MSLVLIKLSNYFFIFRSQYTYKRVTVHQADLESISGLSVHAETSSVKSVPAKDQLFFEKNEPKQMQMQSSSIFEPSSKKRSLPKLKHSASDKPAQPLSLNLPRAEVSTLLQKHISKSRLQELIEEVQGLYTVDKQVKAHAEEDLRKKRKDWETSIFRKLNLKHVSMKFQHDALQNRADHWRMNQKLQG